MLRKTFGKMFTKCLEKVMCLVKKGPLARPLHYIILLQLLIYFINFSFQYATHIWMALGHQFKYDFFQWNMQISSLTQLKANRHLIKHNFSFFFNNKIFLIILFAWPFTVDIVSLPLMTWDINTIPYAWNNYINTWIKQWISCWVSNTLASGLNCTTLHSISLTL